MFRFAAGKRAAVSRQQPDPTTRTARPFAGLMAGLVVHRRVTRRLRDALGAAQAELAAQVLSRRAAETERTHLQAQLLQAQKMEAIGQLASGLAHDFNNTLMAIDGYAGLINAEAVSPNLRAYAEGVAKGVERGTEITRQLLALARPTDSAVGHVDIRPVVTGIVPLIRRVLGSGIVIGLDVPDRPIIARIDACQLEHALINLSINARDAMPGGGRMAVSVAAAQDFVEIKVRDTGSGIRAEHLDRIFEPFFTTKSDGRGSGLGLAMVSRFAAQAGGEVTVESAPGVGTTVAIRLPRAELAERRSPRIGRQSHADHGAHLSRRTRPLDRLAAGSRV
jgi:signal transduction histidine kinase